MSETIEPVGKRSRRATAQAKRSPLDVARAALALHASGRLDGRADLPAEFGPPTHRRLAAEALRLVRGERAPARSAEVAASESKPRGRGRPPGSKNKSRVRPDDGPPLGAAEDVVEPIAIAIAALERLEAGRCDGRADLTAYFSTQTYRDLATETLERIGDVASAEEESTR